MKRDKIKALMSQQWFRPLENCDLEVAIVPAAARNVFDGFMGNTDPEIKARRVCQRAFVDFRNYENGDGLAVPNTLDARLELYSVVDVGAAIDAKLFELNRQAIEGEGNAASG